MPKMCFYKLIKNYIAMTKSQATATLKSSAESSEISGKYSCLVLSVSDNVSEF